MNTVWQEQLDKGAATNPRADYLISPEDLAARLEADGLKVLDATTHLRPTEDGGFASEPGFEDFLSEHIPGAQFADLQGALSDAESSFRFTVPSAGQFARSVGALGITAGDEVVIYSSTHPMWATRMWWLFRLFGHQTVKLLDGGLPAWKAAGLAVEAGETGKVAAEYGEPVRQDDRFVDGEAILARQAAGGLCLINALSEQQYRGEGPHYGRPGHITGSESLPWGSFLNEDLSFKSSDELKAHFDAVGAFDQNEIITYCGGGIAATVPIFSLALLGIEERVALYDRSLSEWAQQGDWPMTQLASG
jgi:thiosulfate/3-mercaptopyruvate sulfurtransferase